MTLILTLLLSFHLTPLSNAVPEERSLHSIFQTIEHDTGYKFLYRDALVAGKTAAFSMGDGWQSSLLSLLEKKGLTASIDSDRKRVIIYENERSLPGEPKTVISGFVIDSQSGERLPYATVSWRYGRDSEKHTQTDINGRFTIRNLSVSGRADFALRVSYVGYSPEILEFGAGSLPMNAPLNIRMDPSRVEISELLVTGISNISPAADTIYRGILDVGTFSPLGDPNTVRMLQTLPSVSHGSSLSEGSYIRGSNSDALRVMLDGSVIYNHSHLFGLIDSFNPDVIRTGSFYYDVAPARYHAPPGGVLNLVTQTGSLHENGGSVGISNSVIKASIDGPIQEGRSSFMIAGRHSILNSVNLFSTSDMVSWGLGIDRKTSLSDEAEELNDRIVTPGDYSADFYDLHTKLFFELDESRSWVVSGYLGGDNTSQISNRITGTASDAARRFTRSDFETENQWGNRSANVSYYQTLQSGRMLHIQGGFSYLYTGYLREDFLYQRPGQDPDRPLLFVSDFENESELNHGYARADVETDKLAVGAALNIYDSAYRERSLNRSDFFQRSRPVMPEVFAEYRLGDAGSNHTASAGARLQYYSDGGYVNVSPRIKAELFRNRPVSLGFSAGRNYQYLYRLSINNHTTSDIWIMALQDLPPARSDQLSANLSFRPWRRAFFQAEGYLKQQTHLRFHEITFQNIESTFGGSPLFNNNDGFSRGIELMFRQAFEKGDLVQSYTYAISELKNDRFRDGESFYAYWDRRHSFSTIASYSPLPGLKASVNWTYSTGRPDQLRLNRETQDRLGSHSRVDLSIGYTASFGSNSLKVQAGVYNLTNNDNPWYREWVQQIDRSGIRPRLAPTLVDVYDLGIQGSVSVGVYF